jgi:hypothetical protein
VRFTSGSLSPLFPDYARETRQSGQEDKGVLEPDLVLEAKGKGKKDENSIQNPKSKILLGATHAEVSSA